MVEFRTSVPGTEGGDNGDSGGDSEMVNKLLQQTKKQLAKDPEKRVQLASALQENYGIDPQITSLFVPGLEEDIKEAQQQEQKQQANIQEQPMPEIEDDSPQIDEEDLENIITDLKDLLGEETTLKELEEIMEKNQGKINGMLQMYL